MSTAYDRAYAACEALARSHYENFPVASRLLPAAMRPHVAAVYAYARIADDLADEGEVSPGRRREQLADWQRRLHAAIDHPAAPGPDEPTDALILAATAQSIRTRRLPPALFDDLLSAFAQDITTTRYDSWTDLLDYCRRSANPVGRLVLRIAGYDDGPLARGADALCTALQLANFWQDFGRDWVAGRLYVPLEASRHCGADERDLAHEPLTPAWTATIALCAERTAALFETGREVCDGVGGRLRLELRLTWLGGRRILDRVVASGPLLRMQRPALGRADVPSLLWQAARWKAVS